MLLCIGAHNRRRTSGSPRLVLAQRRMQKAPVLLPYFPTKDTLSVLGSQAANDHILRRMPDICHEIENSPECVGHSLNYKPGGIQAHHFSGNGQGLERDVECFSLRFH